MLRQRRVVDGNFINDADEPLRILTLLTVVTDSQRAVFQRPSRTGIDRRLECLYAIEVDFDVIALTRCIPSHH